MSYKQNKELIHVAICVYNPIFVAHKISQTKNYNMKKNFLLLIAFVFTFSTSFGQIYFTESFDSGIGSDWTIVNADSDQHTWIDGAAAPHTGAGYATSASWDQGDGPLTPDNWLTSSAIDLSSATGNITLEYWVRAQDQNWPGEHYACMLSTQGNSISNFTTTLMEETLTTSDDAANALYVKRSIDLSQYAGQTVFLAWRHYDCTDKFRINLDDISVFKNEILDAGITAISAPSNNNGCMMTATEAVTVTIFNYGGAPITNFDVSYSIDGGTPVVETVMDTVFASSSMEYTFTQTADLSTLGYYSIKATAMLANDSDNSNDSFETVASHGDATLSVVVSTDNNGAQSWVIVNSNSDTVATHGAYQWGITDTTNVCLIDDDCYSFYWTSENQTSNDVVLSYNGTQIASTTATGPFSQITIGSGCPGDDLELVSINTPSSVIVGDVNVMGTVKNNGTDTLTSFDVVYSTGGTASAIYTISGISITTGETANFTHDAPYVATSGTSSLEVTVSNPNGNTDANPANNVLSKDLLVLNEAFTKVILGEEATGTWCGWCVRGHIGLKDMAHNYTDGSWIGIAVHNADPMANTEYDDAIGDFIGGYPSGVINRLSTEVDPSLFDTVYQILKNELPLAKVVISSAIMDSETREVTVDAASVFAIDTLGDYKLSMIVIEDSITGTSSGYAQANYYSRDDIDILDWEGINWKTLGNPIPAADMIYDHVGRYIVGGFNGVSGSVPTNVTYNDPNSYQFTTTLPASINEEQTSVVVILLDGNGNYVNSTKMHVDVVVSNINIGNVEEVQIFPNPTSGEITIQGEAGASINIFDLLGRVVLTSTMANDKTTIDMSSLENGAYWVEIFNNNTLYSKKVILNK